LGKGAETESEIRPKKLGQAKEVLLGGRVYYGKWGWWEGVWGE